MTIAVSIAIMAAALALATLADRGCWNLIDRLALMLHRFASRGRARQAAIAERLDEQWRGEFS